MKRLFRIAAAFLIASSVFASGEALADPKGRGGDRGRGGWERSEREWGGDRGGGRQGREYRENRGGGRQGREYREDRGERRRDYGPPDVYAYPGGPAFTRRMPPPGYGVRRGGQAPPEYRGAVVPDYGRHRLRPPPPGFAWVRMGSRYALVSRATGQIFDVIGD